MSPDSVAAWATGVGIGLMSVMVVWLVGSRLIALVLDPPLGPTLALVGAMVVGGVAAAISGRQLSRRLSDERRRDARR
jgi:hypothetical protein